MTARTIGIFGGGQLGRLLCLAAPALSLRTLVLATDATDPAAQVADEVLVGSFDSASAAAELAERTDVVTFEIETAAPAALDAIERTGKPVRPGVEIIRLLQNKLAQKQHYRDADIPTASFVPLPHPEPSAYDDLAAKLGARFVQKAQRGGYDGRGVAVVTGPRDLDPAMGPSLAEAYVDRAQELAVLLARGADGDCVCYPPVAMVFHETHNILNHTLAPAGVSPALEAEATALARRAVESLDGVGLFAVELFLTVQGRLLVNEMSPRVHNSGHWTLDGCNVSQFEQHLRAVAGLPLKPVHCKGFVATKNLLGAGTEAGPTRVEGLEAFRDADDVFVHLYGKPLCFPNRKMGHVTAVAADPDAAVRRVEDAASQIRILGGRATV